MLISVQDGGIRDRFGAAKGYKLIADAGFEAIDWNVDHALSGKDLKAAKELKDICIFERSQEEIYAYYEAELAEIRKNGLVISQAHAPFPPYFPGRPDVLDYCIGIYRNLIVFLDGLGVKNLIIHGISRTEEGPEVPYSFFRELNMKLYSSLIPVLKDRKITVCLENLFCHSGIPAHTNMLGTCSNPFEAVSYIDELNALAGRKAFGLCLDTGHANMMRIRFPDYVPVIGERLAAFHIHDNDGQFDRHTGPYTGTIMWEEFLVSVKSVHYEGDLSFETFHQVDAKKAPEALVPEFLRHIYAIGCYFRDYLQN